MHHAVHELQTLLAIQRFSLNPQPFQMIQQLQFECDNFDIVEEILIKLSYSFDPYIIRELPISFNKRVAGESKRDLVKFIISYITTIRKLLRIKHSTVKGR